MNAKRVGRFIVYWVPLLLGTLLVFRYSAGDRGRYEASWVVLQRAIHFLTPNEPYKVNEGGLILSFTMYQLNDAFRRLAHVVLYALVTFLIVRGIQQGAPRLKLASLIAAVVGSAVCVAADEFARSHSAHRHAKIEDIILNAIGVAIILGGTLVFFAIKSLERRLAADAPVPTAESGAKNSPPAAVKPS